MKILVIEDDPTVGQYVKRGLEEQRWGVDLVPDGEEGERRAHSDAYDLIVLDMRLPGRSGMEVLHNLRARGFQRPVLVLTAQDAVDAKVQALRAGADDYVTKPFSPRELALRVRSVLRRAPSSASVLPLDITIGDMVVSTAARSVTINGQPVSLTNREFDLLMFFLTHTDTVFSREELLKQVWRWDFGDLSTVTVHVKRLRSKLGDHHRVQTVWGRGYLWGGQSAD